MKQRIASVVMALGLALGMVVVAEAPASAASACRTSLSVVKTTSPMIVRVDNAGCFGVQAAIRGQRADGSAFLIYGRVTSTGSSTVALPSGARNLDLRSRVMVTPSSSGVELRWGFSTSLQWRTVSG